MKSKLDIEDTAWTPGEWQPSETAPKDGSVFLTYWGEWPVFVAWFEATRDESRPGTWPWSKPRIDKDRDAGFRVLCWSPRFNGWGINGNCAPFTPPYWTTLPYPPPVSP